MEVAPTSRTAARVRRLRARRTRAFLNAGAEPLEPRTLLSVAPAAENTPPATAGVPDLAVDEDAADTIIDLFSLFADDADADEALAFSVVGYSNPKLFSRVDLNGNTGTLKLDYQSQANGTADVTIRAADTQGAATLDTFTVTVRPVNDAPVNRVPGPQVTAPGQTLVFGGQTGSLIGVSDVDLVNGTLTVTLRVDDGGAGAGGTVTLPFRDGLTFLQGDGVADAFVSFSGTIRGVSSALSRLQFDPAPGFTGASTLTLTTDDQGNTGAGGPQTDTDTVAIHVIPPPRLSVADGRVVEGDEGSTSANVTVTLSEAYPLPVRARWATADGTAYSETDLVSDGGFESPPIFGAWDMVLAGNGIGPWAVDAASVDVVSMWQDAEGNQSLDLSGADAGSVYQDLATVPGQTYTLRFALSGNPENRGADPVKTVKVDFGDAAVDTLSFDVTGHSFGDMGWERHAYTVTATSTTTRLRFTSLTAGDTGPAIDDVHVTLPGDYERASGVVEFAAGETSRTITVPVTGDTLAEPDETFFVDLSNPTDATIEAGHATVTILDDDGPPAAAPRVTQVFVSDPQWAQAVKDRMEADGLGSGAAGFGIPAGAGDGGRLAQAAPLPWRSASQVSIRFDSDVVVAGDDLSVRGAGGRTYAVSDFAYDAPSRTATWTLASGFSDDRVVLDLDADDGADHGVRAAGRGGAALDGEWDDNPQAQPGQEYPSGDGAAGGDFGFRFNALAGDVNGDARVNALDLADVKRRLNRTAGDGVAAGGAYSAFADVTTDGTINALDLGAVRQRLNRRLPAETAAPPPPPVASALAPASPGRDLFSTDPILG